MLIPFGFFGSGIIAQMLIAGGTTSDQITPTNVTQKYIFSPESTTSSSTLSTARKQLSAIGNSYVAIFGWGKDSSGTALGSTEKYNYASGGISSGTTLTDAEYAGTGGSISDKGVFISAGNSSAWYNKIYTYASSAVSTGDVGLVANARYLCAFSSQTICYFGGGGASNADAKVTVQKYTYSTDSVSNGTNFSSLEVNETGPNYAAGNNTVGIAVKNIYQTKDTNKYTYSGDVVASGTNLGQAGADNRAANGSATYGYYFGGVFSSPITNVDKYKYSDDSVAAGTSLGTAVFEAAASSTSHGGL